MDIDHSTIDMCPLCFDNIHFEHLSFRKTYARHAQVVSNGLVGMYQ